MYIGLLEDEAHLAQHVSDILETAGHTVTVFPDGAAMVKAIGRDTFDLFVLDWRVPKMSPVNAWASWADPVRASPRCCASSLGPFNPRTVRCGWTMWR